MRFRTGIRCAPPCSLAAVSLLEVMIAVAVLSLGLMAVVGQIAPINSQRVAADEALVAQTVIRTLTERFQNADFASLRSDSLPWSYARPLPLSDGSLPAERVPEQGAGADSNPVIPLDTISGLRGNNLIEQGIVPMNTRLPNLQVFIEYYRAISRFSDITVPTIEVVGTTAQLGLLCEANAAKPTMPRDFRRLVADPATHFAYEVAVRPAEILTTDTGGYSHQYDSVLVRIVVTWGDARLDYGNLGGTLIDWRNNHRVEAWTGIRAATAE